jgi:hypothetical protein
MRRFSALFSSAAFVKLKDPVTTACPSITMAIAACYGAIDIYLGRDPASKRNVSDEDLGVLWLLSRGPHVSPLYLCRPHHHETFPMTEFQISSPRRTTVSSIESGLSGIPKARSFEIILSLVMIASPFFLIATIFPTDEFMGHVKYFEEAKLVRFIKK